MEKLCKSWVGIEWAWWRSPLATAIGWLRWWVTARHGGSLKTHWRSSNEGTKVQGRKVKAGSHWLTTGSGHHRNASASSSWFADCCTLGLKGDAQCVVWGTCWRTWSDDLTWLGLTVRYTVVARARWCPLASSLPSDSSRWAQQTEWRHNGQTDRLATAEHCCTLPLLPDALNGACSSARTPLIGSFDDDDADRVVKPLK